MDYTHLTCTKCGAAKPRDSFSNSTGYRSGKHSHCKGCRRSDARAYYASHSEALGERQRRYDDANLSTYLWRIAKRRADRKDVPFGMTPADVHVPTHCPVLGVPLSRGSRKGETDSSPTIDRLVPSLGYVAGNIRVISGRANRIKADASASEIRALLAWMEKEGLE